MSSSGVRSDPTEPTKRDGRGYTQAQHTAVLRVMKCSATAYYEILDVEKTSTDTQVKKAYRKLALVMHPDKNAAPQADEAFKRVSKAFQVLSDPQLKRVFDQTGSDPESRQPSGFSSAGGRPMGAEFDPNDIFNMFFGQQFGGASPFGGMGGGPQVFSFGGNSFQFGGSPFQQFNGQRARQQARGAAANDEAPRWTQYVPMIGILVIMILVQFLGGDSSSNSAAALPKFSFENRGVYAQERQTPNYKVNYFVNPRDVKDIPSSRLRRLDRHAETTYISSLRRTCDREYTRRENALRDAQGWFSRDEEAYENANNMPMPACEKLDDLGLRLQSY